LKIERSENIKEVFKFQEPPCFHRYFTIVPSYIAGTDEMKNHDRPKGTSFKIHRYLYEIFIKDALIMGSNCSGELTKRVA
jgi:hypothetical protein